MTPALTNAIIKFTNSGAGRRIVENVAVGAKNALVEGIKIFLR